MLAVLRFFPGPVFAVCLLLFASTSWAQIVRETVFFDVPAGIAVNPLPAPTAQLEAVPGYPLDPARQTLIALLYHPDPGVHGPGPYPAVVVLHGSGGMWSGDTIANGPTSHFEKWGQLLAGRGFLCVIADSFNPRGIPGGFGSRRPHHDSAIDDAVCSPNYERPKDVVAALTYLMQRADFDRRNAGLLGFSHGSQTGLNAILDPSVDLGTYQVDYINDLSQTVKLDVPSPVRIPPELPFPRMCVFYYPGCGHFSYHGSPNSVAAGRYMPDRRTQVVMFHGTSDSLMGVSDVNATPKTGNLYPIKFTLASAAQAAAEGVANPFVHHFIFDKVAHSFDETTIEPQGNWDTPSESVNEKANRLAQPETLKWMEFRLRDHALAIEPDLLNPGEHLVLWTGRPDLRYRVQSGIDLIDWPDESEIVIGTGVGLSAGVVIPVEQRIFYRLWIDPVPAPDSEPANTDFYLEYGDFSS